MATSFDERVWAAVGRIPRGRVASYRDIAALAGSPLASRIVAGALKRGPEGLPWWRVLGADGSLRIMNPQLRREQWERLASEGVIVDGDGVVEMTRFRWDATPARGRRARPPTRPRPSAPASRGAGRGKRGPSR